MSQIGSIGGSQTVKKTEALPQAESKKQTGINHLAGHVGMAELQFQRDDFNESECHRARSYIGFQFFPLIRTSTQILLLHRTGALTKSLRL